MPHLNDVRLTLRSSRPAATNADHLVAADVGRDEVGVRSVVLEQRLRELRQPEEVALLAQALDRVAAGRTAASVEQLRFRHEQLVDGAVPAFVAGLVEVAAIAHPPPDRLRRALVPRFGRADEVVVRDVQDAEQLAVFRGDAIGEHLRCRARPSARRARPSGRARRCRSGRTRRRSAGAATARSRRPPCVV